MPGRFNAERAAAILAEATMTSDAAAAAHHGVTTRSVENWRARLATDPELSGFFRAHLHATERQWVGPAVRALVSLARAVERGADAVQNPELSDLLPLVAVLERLHDVLAVQALVESESHAARPAAPGADRPAGAEPIPIEQRRAG